MSAPAAIIEHGTSPNYELVNETGLLVTSVRFSPKREYVEKKSAGTRAVTYVRAENPTMDISIGGKPIPSAQGNLAGVCLTHPGNTTALANFTTSDVVHGFTYSATALLLYKDPTLDLSDTESPTTQIEATFYPFVVIP
jgi:hypothetical protein